MMNVTKEELDQYYRARKKIMARKQPGATPIEYSKYSIKSWKASGLPADKYLHIADFIDISKKRKN